MDPKRLGQIPFFEGVSKKDLQQVGTWTDEVDVPAGKKLAEQGTFAYEFFVIEDGTADVTQDGQKVRSLGPGDFFGEIGLLESERRTATVVATAPMRLVVMTGQDFRTMESKLPHVGQQVRAKIAERLGRDTSGG